MSVEPCVHCWHTERRTMIDAGLSSTMQEGRMCCYCGTHKMVHFEKSIDSLHGQFAPLIWREIE